MVDMSKYGLEGFKKVGEEGGTYVVDTFYNEQTGELKSMCVRDYDYSDCSRDIDELYYMPIDEQARRDYRHKVFGSILEGDTVKVVKGRKMPIGYIGKVTKIKAFNDRYGRFVCDYAYFEDGQRTNTENLELID